MLSQPIVRRPRVSVEMPTEMHAWLVEHARAELVTPSHIVRWAIDAYIKAHPRQD